MFTSPLLYILIDTLFLLLKDFPNFNLEPFFIAIFKEELTLGILL